MEASCYMKCTRANTYKCLEITRHESTMQTPDALRGNDGNAEAELKPCVPHTLLLKAVVTVCSLGLLIHSGKQTSVNISKTLIHDQFVYTYS